MRKIASTLNLPREEWLRIRKSGIGGSDAGAISGLNPYVSPMHVYLEKTSDFVEDVDNEAMRQGRDLEEYVAQRFSEATGKKVQRCNYTLACEDPGYEFMIANIDRRVVGEDSILECKTASALHESSWKAGKIPPHYLCQCYHYLSVSGAKSIYLAICVLGKSFRYFKIDRDEGVINNLKAIEYRFWHENVLALNPPDPDGSDATEEYFRQRYKDSDPGKSVVLSSEYSEKLKRYEEISELMKKLDQEKKKIEEETKAYMDTAEVGVADGYLVSWKSYESERLDTKMLKAEKPEIYKDYAKTTSSRRFTVRVA